MKLIKLTSHKDDSFIYVNINEIGHFYEVKESQMWYQGEPIVKKHTIVGLTTHSNGGFKVMPEFFYSCADCPEHTYTYDKRKMGGIRMIDHCEEHNKNFTNSWPIDRKSTRLNSSHTDISRMPSSA